MPTVDCFTVPRPPRSACRFICVRRVVPVRCVSRLPPVSFNGACVFVPCGILRAPWPSEWSRVRSAASSVARVCLLTPLLLRTTVIWPSISSSLQEERGGGRSRWDVSLTSRQYHGVQLSNFDTTSSTPQHVQATTQSQIRSGQHLVHVHTRFIIMLATCKVYM